MTSSRLLQSMMGKAPFSECAVLKLFRSIGLPSYQPKRIGKYKECVAPIEQTNRRSISQFQPNELHAPRLTPEGVSNARFRKRTMACFTLPVFIPGSGGQLPMSKSLMSKPLRPLIPDRLASAVRGKVSMRLRVIEQTQG